MAKGNTAATLSPYVFVAGTPVTEDDYSAALEESAHAAGYNPEVLAAGGAPEPLAAFQPAEVYQHTFDTAEIGNWVEYFRGSFRIDDEHQSLSFEGLAEFAAGEDGDVRLLVDGVVRATLNFDDTTNDTWQAASVSAATIGGAGEYDFAIEFNLGAGAVATDNRLIAWLLQVEAVTSAASWPDPSG